jgi:mercuric ion transport protein
MRKYNIPIIGAVFTALASTLCCLPAFFFIFFGMTSSLFTIFTTLEYIRIPMAVLTVILLILGLRQLNKNISCSRDKKMKLKLYTLSTAFSLFLVFLLFYPEILPYFMD